MTSLSTPRRLATSRDETQASLLLWLLLALLVVAVLLPLAAILGQAMLAADGSFAGLLTATDVLGERPLKQIHEHGKRHREIVVGDVMTPRKQLEALNLADISRSTVGHIVATMKDLGRQHALVVEHNAASGHYEVCGLFSTSTIARRLGTSLNFVRVPKAFSEIEHALMHEE